MEAQHKEPEVLVVLAGQYVSAHFFGTFCLLFLDRSNMAGRGSLLSTPEKVWRWDAQRAAELGLAGPNVDQRVSMLTAANQWVVAAEPMVLPVFLCVPSALVLTKFIGLLIRSTAILTRKRNVALGQA
jgi:hypothetical protein